MRFMSRLGKPRKAGEGLVAEGIPRQYESVISMESSAAPSVRFTIYRISFGRRMELSRRVRELTRKAEFLQAGAEIHEKLEASILAQDIDAMYLTWGLVSIEGLTIDGELATAERLLAKGPEPLVREVVDAIKAQCGLSEPERKN
jgi:hypothetical protein